MGRHAGVATAVVLWHSLWQAFAAPIVPSVHLQNAAQANVLMPVIGLGVGAYGTVNGTFGEYWDDVTCFNAVSQWLALGGRRIDTSLKYYNDLAGVGWAIRNSSVPREQIFVTSKVDDPYGFNTTVEHIDALLATSGLDYVDLLLIHWPGPIFFLNHTGTPLDEWCHENGPVCRQQTWTALELAFKQGKARAIGTANFEQRQLEDLLALKSLVPAVNQIEYHPYWHEDSLQQFCEEANITVNGYAPLGAPDYMGWNMTRWPVPILSQPAVIRAAANHGKTPAQVLLQWSLQMGVVINPRSSNPVHMFENLALFDPSYAFTLTQAEMDTISAVPVPTENKVCPDPSLIP